MNAYAHTFNNHLNSKVNKSQKTPNTLFHQTQIIINTFESREYVKKNIDKTRRLSYYSITISNFFFLKKNRKINKLSFIKKKQQCQNSVNHTIV